MHSTGFNHGDPCIMAADRRTCPTPSSACVCAHPWQPHRHLHWLSFEARFSDAFDYVQLCNGVHIRLPRPALRQHPCLTLVIFRSLLLLYPKP